MVFGVEQRRHGPVVDDNIALPGTATVGRNNLSTTYCLHVTRQVRRDKVGDDAFARCAFRPGVRQCLGRLELGPCVEVANLGNAVAVRDSKDPDGPALIFTPGEWAAFLQGAKAGEFDHS